MKSAERSVSRTFTSTRRLSTVTLLRTPLVAEPILEVKNFPKFLAVDSPIKAGSMTRFVPLRIKRSTDPGFGRDGGRLGTGSYRASRTRIQWSVNERPGISSTFGM